MKTATLLFPVFFVTASANIIFSHVKLTCNLNDTRIYHGCLRGQDCAEGGECVPQMFIRDSYYGLVPKLQERTELVYSTDGRCGGDIICNPNSKVYQGGCCSQYGWCGNTDNHCGDGCQSGCATPVEMRAGTDPRPDGRCGNKYGGALCDSKGPYGGCCSEFGYCGSTRDHCLNKCQSGCLSINPGRAQANAAEPVMGKPSEPSASRAPNAAATGAVTTDGSCGASNGNTICGNWRNGNCCSMYGFCGSTNGHCGAGCQSGNCLSAPVVAAPGPSPAPPAQNPGYFTVIGQSGVPAMHAGLLPNGKVFFLDKLENYSQLRTPNGRYAMSSEYDPNTNTVVPLAYRTNAFCSGGAFLADGSVVSLGGNGPLKWLDPNILDGFNAIRRLYRSAQNNGSDGANWIESDDKKLASARWYATAQTMPDGSIFVASGSLNGLDPSVPSNNNPTYEILNADATARGVNYPMDILQKNQPYYMYPFVHLLNDGSLFMFVSKSAQIFNVGSNKIVRELPDLPGDYRTYPNSGGSVLLPLSSANGWRPDIMICGGGAYQDITSPCDASCGRIQPLSPNPNWEMDSMPEGRGMVEGVLLPDGTVIWLNGGSRGAQGFGLMSKPALEVLLYDPKKPRGQRFSTLAASGIPRLYHSVAILLLDGTVLVTGSNPNEMPVLEPNGDHPYITDFRVEVFVPPYLQGGNAKRRPANIVISNKNITADGSVFTASFNCPPGAQAVKVVLYHGGFVTHSVHMGHRMVELDTTRWAPGVQSQNLFVNAPPSRNVAPPGPYVLFVVVDGVPGVGQFVQIA